jgi:hypothetical protein
MPLDAATAVWHAYSFRNSSSQAPRLFRRSFVPKIISSRAGCTVAGYERKLVPKIIGRVAGWDVVPAHGPNPSTRVVGRSPFQNSIAVDVWNI